MADELRIGLSELLRKAMVDHDTDFLKEGVRVLSQALMEMEVEEHVGAARHERSARRVGQRNGYRERSWDTRVGTVELKVPRVRDGGYFPSLLEPRRKAERALAAVVQEAYVHGVSTRKVDDLVKALGMGGISKSRVSEICEDLDEEVERFRNRPLEGSYPYVWVDATYVKARQDGRVVSVAVVIAVGVNAKTGEREVLGLDVGPSEDGAFWVSFLRSLVSRGLRGVRLVDQRRAPGAQRRHRGGPGRRLVAEVQGPLHAQRPLFGSEGGPANGGSYSRHRLRPARLGKRPRAVAQGLGGLPLTVSPGSRS